MGKKPVVVNLRVFKGTKMSFDENGVPQNENQSVKLMYDTVEWKNFLANFKANAYCRVDVLSASNLDKKQVDGEFVDNLSPYDGISKVKEEVAKALSANTEIKETPEEKRIKDLENTIAELKALIGGKSEGKKPIDESIEDEDLEAVKKEYEEIFGKAPHHKAKLETLKKEIEESKK